MNTSRWDHWEPPWKLLTIPRHTHDFFGYFRHMKVDGGESGEGRKQEKKGEKDQGRLLGKSKTLMESMQNGLLKMFLKNKQRRMQKI